MSQLETFRNRVEAFLKREKMPPTRFGILAVSDPSFIRTLRAGRAPNMATADKVLAFMRDYRAERAA